VKPGKAATRYPPVIDAFSRTLAAPISNEKEYFPVSHKLGTNFSQETKGLYIDIEARAVRFKKMGQGQPNLNIVGDSSITKYADVEPASE
jgi:dynein heavy chain